MSKIIQEIVCPACGASITAEGINNAVYPGARRGFGPEKICFCGRCGSGMALPLPQAQELEKFYSQGEYWQEPAAQILEPRKFPGHYALALARWDFVRFHLDLRPPAPLAILDVGAGHGFFGMAAAADPRLKLEKYCAVEQDRILRESLKSTWHKYFTFIEFEAYKQLPRVVGKYDILVLSNILEHLIEPAGLLRQAAGFLKPGGYCFIDVPHQDWRFKKDVFPHLSFFSPEGLRLLMENSDFQVTALGVYGRRMEKSPLHHKNAKKPVVKLASLVHKMRRVVPLPLSRRFFHWYFGASRKTSRGTWIRALAKKTGERA